MDLAETISSATTVFFASTASEAAVEIGIRNPDAATKRKRGSNRNSNGKWLHNFNHRRDK